MHTHPAEELFFLLEGDFEFPTLRAGQIHTTRATAGSVVHVPGAILHTYHNVSAGHGRLLGVLTPAGDMEAFFREAGIPLDDPDNPPAPAGPPDMAAFLAICGKHHIEFVGPSSP